MSAEQGDKQPDKAPVADRRPNEPLGDSLLGPFGRASVSIGRIFGIRVGVDLSWILVFILVTVSMAQELAAAHKDWSPRFTWAAGALASLLYFLSVLLHELCHCLAAKALGFPVRSFTLFIFGGVTRSAAEPARPQDEFLIAIAGPTASFMLAIGWLAGAFVWKASVSSGGGMAAEALIAISSYLALINFFLLAFNLIPGFPLDGGRVLRSFLWAGTGDWLRATRIAAAAGAAFAAMLAVAGLALASWKGQTIYGLWLALIGWFLWSAARASATHAAMREAMRRIRVGEAYEMEVPRAPGRLSVQQLIEGPILERGQQVFLVENDDRVTSIITVNEARAVPEEERVNTPIQAAAIPIERIASLSPGQTLWEALEQMERIGAGLMPVVEGGELLGVLTRERMARVLRDRAT